jgi:hypothetical protein
LRVGFKNSSKAFKNPKFSFKKQKLSFLTVLPYKPKCKVRIPSQGMEGKKEGTRAERNSGAKAPCFQSLIRD